jgi:hypothetical protein
MPLRNYVFRANRCSESHKHTLLTYIKNKEIADFTVFFPPIWLEFITGNVHQNYLMDCEFRENRRSESYTLHRVNVPSKMRECATAQ